MVKKNSNETRTWGLVALGAFATTGLGLLLVSVPFILPAIRKVCLPYVPATDMQVENVMRLLKKRQGKLIDLGSGDGRIVFAAAQQGFLAHGVELNPWLVLYSKIKAYKLGLHNLASFKRQDIWKTNLEKYENIVIFGVDIMMPILEKKLSEELNSNACVLACRYPLPNWIETTSIGHGIDTVWFYEKQSQKRST